MTKKQKEALKILHAVLVLSDMDNADHALCKAFPFILKEVRKEYESEQKKKINAL